jgi:hypothetical protein
LTAGGLPILKMSREVRRAADRAALRDTLAVKEQAQGGAD